VDLCNLGLQDPDSKLLKPGYSKQNRKFRDLKHERYLTKRTFFLKFFKTF
jgi:hypothetical protein